MMGTLSNLLSHGRLGLAKIGQDIVTVRDVLGVPDDKSTSKKPLILKYGTTELSFYYEKSTKIYTLLSMSLHYRFDEFQLPKNVHVIGWFPVVGDKIGNVIENLNKLSVEYKKSFSSFDDIQIEIEHNPNSNICSKIIFDSKNDNTIYNIAVYRSVKKGQ